MRTTIYLLAGMLIVLLASFSLSHPTHYDQAFLQVLPLILSALGTAYSIYSQENSQDKAEKEQKKYQKDLEKRRSDYEAWFNSEYNRDFLDTEQGKSTINQLGNTLKNTLQNQNNAAVRGGATPEAQVAAQGVATDTFANALNQLTAQGTAYKQNLRNSYDYRIQNYLQPLDQLQMQKINNYTSLGAQTGQTTGDLTNALAMYDWEGLLGGTGG